MPGPERGVVLLTTTPALATRIVDEVGAAFADVEWSAVRPEGSRLAVLRALASERFDRVVVCWTGHPAHNRMKLLGLLVARRHSIYNENLHHYRIAVQNRSWIGHIRWRLGLPRGLASCAMTAVFRAYQWTVGLAVGGTLRVARYASWQARRRPGQSIHTG